MHTNKYSVHICPLDILYIYRACAERNLRESGNVFTAGGLWGNHYLPVLMTHISTRMNATMRNARLKLCVHYTYMHAT